MNSISSIANNVISVDFDGSPYEIHVGRSIVNNISKLIGEKTKNKTVMIVADSFFEQLVVKKVEEILKKNNYKVFVYLMSAGKTNKNINEVLKVCGILEENDIARDSTLIAIGGGVIGDLAGFVASVWYRGINLVHIPTTLMAMVDSSVGGKVAINFRQTINAIGNYHHPIFTIMDLSLIDTLPDRDYKSGIAEVIKCAIINDKEFYGYLKNNVKSILDRNEKDVVYFLLKAIKIKIAHVLGDVREGNKRLLLNYGHTLGHAIEISTEISHQEQYRHGEGVSIGIMAATYISTEYLGVSEDVFKSVESLLLSYGLPIYVDSERIGLGRDLLLDNCLRNVKKDKKRINHHLRLILADKIGKASIYTDVPFRLVERSFDSIIR